MNMNDFDARADFFDRYCKAGAVMDDYTASMLPIALIGVLTIIGLLTGAL